MLIIVQNELTLLLFHYLVLFLRFLGVVISNWVVRRYYPGVLPKIRGCAHLLYLETLHFIFRKTLLHAPADESLAVFGQSVENFDQGQGLLVRLVSYGCEVLDGVYQAAGGLDIWDLLQVLFVYHFEVPCCCQDQEDT